MVAVDGTALPAPLAAAAQRLHDRLTACARTAPALAVAYSGGVDSRFLCLALQREGIPFLALHAGGPHVPEAESRTAIRIAVYVHRLTAPAATSAANPPELMP